MPELPEVEVLVRHLGPLLQHKTVREVRVRRAKVLAPTSVRAFTQRLRGARFVGLTRRGKYLLFQLQPVKGLAPLTLVGHLGMTGRMYLLPVRQPLPKHAAVVLNLGRENFVFEDTRYFGRLTLADGVVQKLGPEPLSPAFTPEKLWQALRRSSQPIKVKLLDQSLVAGVGNIYASEALFRARIAPERSAHRLTALEVRRLWQALRRVLQQAIDCGSTVPLNYAGEGQRDGIFYFGRAPGAEDFYQERLRVYDREGEPCPRCRTAIRRLTQAGRSTFFCPRCQSQAKRQPSNPISRAK